MKTFNVNAKRMKLKSSIYNERNLIWNPFKKKIDARNFKTTETFLFCVCVFLRNLTCWNENCFWKEALQEKRSLLGKCWPLIKSDSKIDMIKVLLQPLFCSHENISNQNCVRTKSPVIFFSNAPAWMIIIDGPMSWKWLWKLSDLTI